MQSARVAVYGAGGAPFHHAAVLRRAGHRVDFVFPHDILGGALAGFDVFVMPGGGYRAMFGQLEPLGTEGTRTIREFVRSGGMYLGSCAGSYSAAAVAPSFTELCPAQTEMRLLDATVVNEDGESWGLRSPGIGVLEAENVAPDHPVMAGVASSFEIAHYNGPLFLGAQALARVRGRTSRFTAAEAFLGAEPSDTLADEAAARGVANVVAGACGDGRVVLFGSHPEFGFDILMDDEPGSAVMVRNAVAWQLAESGAPRRPEVDLHTDGAHESHGAAEQVAKLADDLRTRTAAIRARGTGARWLEPAYAMSFFGLTPTEIWTRSLDAVDRLASDAARRAPGTRPDVLSFRPPVEWELDGGYHGVVALLEQAVELLDRAIATWDVDPGPPPTNAYESMRTSPYHLVAGSYLAASGRVAGAALLCTAYRRSPED
ncbi:BPL-N domain-containing protein [Pseudonocardia sp. MH-G8]|uniref:BPL-N domain-containing protein n=1 Tax=Pseudonocardia sp. MH-G8 TaxID=1854588 RepID=UPI000BA0EB3A|nr:BPL-N domain-containing protein [Pseudonocardia sp. MH-G8]OZM77959.1 hypothetical protein CFP66_33390 [Pseudonocardia sp. MH-G8]